MRTLILLLGFAATTILAIGCEGPSSSPPASKIRGVDELIADLKSDNGLKVEMAAIQLKSGDRPASDLEKALPALKDAAKKKWGHPRISMSINQAIRAAKQRKP